MHGGEYALPRHPPSSILISIVDVVNATTPLVKNIVDKIKRELAYYRALWAHPGTPRLSRWLLAGALAYLISPIDLIPDAIPILGQIDDLVIVPSLIFAALAFIPSEVKDACRRQTAA
jgi:uncharacterized membrane protein YkvA (DUF1232 family)